MSARAEELSLGKSCGRHVFVYGTLVDPRRLREVLGHPHQGEVFRARLVGYRRVSAPSYEYPFVVRDSSASVEGLLVMDLTPADVEALDAYEDVADGVYRRVPVEVEAWGCGALGTRLQAETYAAGPGLLSALAGRSAALNRP